MMINIAILTLSTFANICQYDGIMIHITGVPFHKNGKISACTRTAPRLDQTPLPKKQNEKATPKSAPRSTHKNCAGMANEQHHDPSNSKKQCPKVVAQELPPPQPQRNRTQDRQGSVGTPKSKKTKSLQRPPKIPPRKTDNKLGPSFPC